MNITTRPPQRTTATPHLQQPTSREHSDATTTTHHRDAPPVATRRHHLQQLATRPPPLQLATRPPLLQLATQSIVATLHRTERKHKTKRKNLSFFISFRPPFKTTQFCFFKKKPQLDSPTRTRVASPHRVYRFHTESTEFTSKPSLLTS